MNKKEQICYISLGSNQGDSKKNIQDAVSAINLTEGIKILKASGVYQTEPQDDKDQPWFFNQVVKAACLLSPEKLLEELQRIENSLGRTRTGRRYGPRTIDLDILLFGDIKLQGEKLTIPHPRIPERAFVLVPLAEIDPMATLPGGAKVKDLLACLKYTLADDKIYQNL